MTNRLAASVSPYLRSHSENPVDWYPWGADAFAEADRRQVPVLISIGYATCHWCHVMARESFSNADLAEYLNANFVSIKVDREEHPDVDSSYLAAAGAFTDQLGWPLTVFATPTGKAFYAGTYYPPTELPERPSFRQVLTAVLEAWSERRDDVEDTAGRLAVAISAPQRRPPAALLGGGELSAVVSELRQYEDRQFGGFGAAPKFPVATVLGFLLDCGDAGDAAAGDLGRRALDAMAGSELRDPVEGGFFRYAVQRNWTEPHYERMLYDNSLLLDAYSRTGQIEVAEGIARFLLETLRVPGGGFASAQDSESTVDGIRVEGGYYALDAEGRARQTPPTLDNKVLTGWNGLAIGALARAGSRLPHPDWIAAAAAAADAVWTEPLVRARVGDAVSSARPTLEDYGMLAHGLTRLALATGEVRFAARARALVAAAGGGTGTVPFAAPGGADPVLVERGLALEVDPSEGAYPSGLSATSAAAVLLDLMGAGGGFRGRAIATMELVAPLAAANPMSFGAALGVMSALAEPKRQLVIVADDGNPFDEIARAWRGFVTVVTVAQARAFADAGFGLYEARGLTDGKPTAYLCEDFVCQLPVTNAAQLAAMLH